MIDFIDGIAPDQDTIPIVDTVEWPCRICGKEAGPYSGRGRHPATCKECKPARTSSQGRVKGSNANLAAQATQALMSMNGFAAIGLMLMQLPATSMKLSECNDEALRQQIYEALLLDPDLCRTIVRGGVKSGKLALIIAYVGLGAAVFPTALVELKEKKAERQQAREAAELEDRINLNGHPDPAPHYSVNVG